MLNLTFFSFNVNLTVKLNVKSFQRLTVKSQKLHVGRGKTKRQASWILSAAAGDTVCEPASPWKMRDSGSRAAQGSARMAAMASDASDLGVLFDAHLGLLNAAVSFSERLRRARQLDQLLESFADAEDSGEEEWGGTSIRMPRGTVAVAAARSQPSLANQPFSPSTSECSSAATTRIASGCSSASTPRAPPTPDRAGPHPPAVYHAGAELWIAEAETFDASAQRRPAAAAAAAAAASAACLPPSRVSDSDRRGRTLSRPSSALRRQQRRPSTREAPPLAVASYEY